MAKRTTSARMNTMGAKRPRVAVGSSVPQGLDSDPPVLMLLIIPTNKPSYTVKVKHDEWQYVLERKVHVFFDGKTLQVRHQKTESGELAAVIKQLKDMQNEIEHREAEEKRLQKELQELMAATTPPEDHVSAQIVRQIHTHNCAIKKLKNMYKLEINFKKTTVTNETRLLPFTLTQLPFFDHPVIFQHRPTQHTFHANLNVNPLDQHPERREQMCTKTWLTADAYMFDIGVKQNFCEAERLYSLAANKDKDLYASAMRLAANKERKKEDLTECFELLKTIVGSQENALSEVDVRAVHFLGRCYDHGLGVQVDSKKAVEYLQNAADQGHAVAQNVLATLYDMGRGVARDRQNAAYWYRVSAEQGYHHAQYNLGVCYRDGLGVKQHTEMAIHWFVEAAKQRNTPAMKKVLIQLMIVVVQILTRWDINNGFFFSAPVDKKKYPKYRKVKKPKDLSTIARKLLANSYNSQDEVAQDIRQVFQNAIKIAPSHAISTRATRMLGEFEKWYENWQAYQAARGIQKKP